MHHKKMKWRLGWVVIFVAAVFVIAAPRVPGMPHALQSKLDTLQINLGLDLQGGLHLEYAMDLSEVPDDQKADATDAVQAVVERRVNAFGVGEPIVQVATRDLEKYLIVELPGIRDIEKAKDIIRATPFLDFREERSPEEISAILDPVNDERLTEAEDLLARVLAGEDFDELARAESDDAGSAENGGDLDFRLQGDFVEEFDAVIFDEDLADGAIHPELVETTFGWHIIKKNETKGEGEDREVRSQHILIAKETIVNQPDLAYKPTELTGKYLEGAAVDFGGGHGAGVGLPQVALAFDGEGTKIFAEMTERNLDRTIAIFIDDELVSAPVVQAIIANGQALINGDYTLDEAKALAQRLNEGALPVPIELVSQQSVEASLGAEALATSLKAGAVGLLLVVLYMTFFYRILGLIAGGAIVVYAATIVALFKLSSAAPGGLTITLTLAGVAGLILSIGMAVDANVLIFERIREELDRGRGLKHAVDEAFKRAWSAIRDGNISTILTSVILMTIGTGFVKGFALILIIGVLMSMFTAIVLVRAVMYFFAGNWLEDRLWLIYNPKRRVAGENEAKE